MIATGFSSVSTTIANMKNHKIKFSWQVLTILFFFSCGKAKKTCKPGQEDDVLQQYYHTVRGKFVLVAKLTLTLIEKVHLDINQ